MKELGPNEGMNDGMNEGIYEGMIESSGQPCIQSTIRINFSMASQMTVLKYREMNPQRGIIQPSI